MSITLLDTTQNVGTFRVITDAGTEYRVVCSASTSVLASGGSLLMPKSLTHCLILNHRICVGESMVLTQTTGIAAVGRKQITTSKIVEIEACV